MEDKYFKLKKEVLMMMNNFWAINNNSNCEQATLHFLKRNGLYEKFNEISYLDVKIVNKDIKDEYQEYLNEIDEDNL